jgi:uncharacterized damage-inducible protein DinB
MTFKNLGHYHVWAGERMREMVRQLDDKNFVRKVRGKSVKDLCEHMVLALETCFFYGDNSSDESVFGKVARFSREELMSRWQQLDVRLGRIIEEIPQGKITVTHISEEPFDVDSLDFYLQYLLHTTHHRGQLAATLRALGVEVLGTDYLLFLSKDAADWIH